MNNTGNPVGSTDPRDLIDNAEVFDKFTTGADQTVVDRKGRTLKTLKAFDSLVTNAQSQISQIIAEVNNAADSAISEMQETAENLGDDLNNKSYTSYAKMLADPQTRDAVVGIVSGDLDPNLDGWYRFDLATGRWNRFSLQPLMSDIAYGDDNIFSVLDSNNLETWLSVNSKDGGPSKHSERLIRNMLKIQETGRTGYICVLADANGVMTDLAIRDTDGQFDEFVIDRLSPRINSRLPNRTLDIGRTGYLYAFTDANGVMTDLCVDDTTGQFPPFVVQRLAPRLAPYLPQPSGDSAWLLNDRYADYDGSSRRVFAKPLSWSGWGSSTIDEWSELGTIAGQFGATYYNGGNGATELQHNLAQMGARPALLLPQGGEIPASGSVVVACSNVIPVAAFKATAGTLAGVSGTLTSSASEWTFTRTVAGSAVAVSQETPFIPTEGAIHRGDVWLMNEGKNDINNGRPMEQTMAWHKLAYSWNSALSKRVIAMTHFGHTGNTNPGHTAKCKQLNAFIEQEYEDHVFDLAGYLCSPQIWVDTGLTPTTADLQNQAAGCLAATLSRDNMAHMNSTARTAAANKIKAQLISMGWFNQ